MKLAGSFEDVFGTIQQPPQLRNIGGGDPTGVTGINNLLTNTVSLFYMIATIVFVIMILWACYDFIVSHGEKDPVAKARAKITWAIIGLVLLGISFVIFRVLERLTGIPILI